MGLGSRGTELACIAPGFTRAVPGFVTGVVKAPGRIVTGIPVSGLAAFHVGFQLMLLLEPILSVVGDLFSLFGCPARQLLFPVEVNQACGQCGGKRRETPHICAFLVCGKEPL